MNFAGPSTPTDTHVYNTINQYDRDVFNTQNNYVNVPIYLIQIQNNNETLSNIEAHAQAQDARQQLTQLSERVLESIWDLVNQHIDLGEQRESIRSQLMAQMDRSSALHDKIPLSKAHDTESDGISIRSQATTFHSFESAYETVGGEFDEDFADSFRRFIEGPLIHSTKCLLTDSKSTFFYVSLRGEADGGIRSAYNSSPNDILSRRQRVNLLLRYQFNSLQETDIVSVIFKAAMETNFAALNYIMSSTRLKRLKERPVGEEIQKLRKVVLDREFLQFYDDYYHYGCLLAGVFAKTPEETKRSLQSQEGTGITWRDTDEPSAEDKIFGILQSYMEPDLIQNPNLVFSKYGYCVAIKLLLGTTISIDDALSFYNKCLIKAVACNNLEVIRLLIEAGADVNCQNKYGYTLLMLAFDTLQWLSESARSSAEAFKLLVEKGADVNRRADIRRNKVTLLIQASIYNSTGDVKQLLIAGAHVNAVAMDGRTALIAATLKERTDMIILLLASGASVNAAMENGLTALMAASLTHNAENMKLLLQAGADVNSARRDGETALSSAVRRGHIEVARLLVKFGADINAAVEDGYSPLMLAVRNKDIGMLKMLVGAGADDAATILTKWT